MIPLLSVKKEEAKTRRVAALEEHHDEYQILYIWAF
jgi:hypothetical protein